MTDEVVKNERVRWQPRPTISTWCHLHVATDAIP